MPWISPQSRANELARRVRAVRKEHIISLKRAPPRLKAVYYICLRVSCTCCFDDADVGCGSGLEKRLCRDIPAAGLSNTSQ